MTQLPLNFSAAAALVSLTVGNSIEIDYYGDEDDRGNEYAIAELQSGEYTVSATIQAPQAQKWEDLNSEDLKCEIAETYGDEIADAIDANDESDVSYILNEWADFDLFQDENEVKFETTKNEDGSLSVKWTFDMDERITDYSDQDGNPIGCTDDY